MPPAPSDHLLVTPGERAMSSPSAMREGSIVYVNSSGVAIVEVPGSSERYGFAFDKIHGYRGEEAKELGLIEGRRVLFSVSDETVFEVRLVGETSSMALPAGMTAKA
jgi:hypothetical protein